MQPRESSPRVGTVLDRKREREDSDGNDVIFFAPSRTLATQRLDIALPQPQQHPRLEEVRSMDSSLALSPSRLQPHVDPLPAFRPYEAPVEQRFVRGTTPTDLVRHIMNRTTPDSQLLMKV